MTKLKTKEPKLTITQLIKKLERVRAKHGNVAVHVFNTEEFAKGYLSVEMAQLSLEANNDGKVIGITFVDYETAVSFS